MPWKASPLTLACTECGWRITIIPHGDVIPAPVSCPKCSRTPLTQRSASNVEILKAKLAPFLRK